MPKLCEKCGYYDPAPTLTADSRCPSCGLVYATLPQPRHSGATARTDPTVSVVAAAGPGEPAALHWLPVKPLEFWGSVAVACVLFAIIVYDDDGFILLLDGANLAFHEAGHLFFGLLGSTLGLYGGTLGQLAFPIAAAVNFRHRHQAAGAALSGVWLFQNLLNIARYMADARAQVLPLVGGGEHDWYHIFSRWGVLERDTAIAAVTQTIGWLGMVGCVVWLWRRFRVQPSGT